MSQHVARKFSKGEMFQLCFVYRIRFLCSLPSDIVCVRVSPRCTKHDLSNRPVLIVLLCSFVIFDAQKGRVAQVVACPQQDLYYTQHLHYFTKRDCKLDRQLQFSTTMSSSNGDCNSCRMGIFCYDHVKGQEGNPDEPQTTRPYERPTVITVPGSPTFCSHKLRYQVSEPNKAVSCKPAPERHEQHYFQIPQIFVNGKKVFG